MNARRLVSISLFAAGAAFAGPLDRSCVGPQATWLVHVDVEAARASSLYRMVEGMPDNPLPAASAKVKDELGLDPLADILGVTVYGDGASTGKMNIDVGTDGKHLNVGAGAKGPPENAVAVLTTTEAAIDLHARLRLAGKADEGELVAGVTVFAMTHDDEELYVCVRPGKRATERYVVFGASRDQVAAAAGVLAGGASLKVVAPPAPLDSSPGEGAIVFVAIAKLDGAMKTPPKAAVFRNTRAVRFEAGERDEAGQRVFFADADLGVETSERARQMEQVVRGAMAMGLMATEKSHEREALTALVNGVKLEADGATLKVRASYDAAKAVETLKAAAAAERAEGKGADDED